MYWNVFNFRFGKEAETEVCTGMFLTSSTKATSVSVSFENLGQCLNSVSFENLGQC